MAEGGFDELEMDKFDVDKIEDYSYTQLTDNYEDLILEMDELRKQYGDNEKTPENIRMKYVEFNTTLDVIDNEKERRYEESKAAIDNIENDKERRNEELKFIFDNIEKERRNDDDLGSDSFIDSDNGKTVTINGLAKTPAVKFVPSDNLKFDDIDEGLYKVIDETIRDNESIFDENKYDDVMARLKDVKSKNKANIDDQLERVVAVAKIVQRKYKVNLNPNNAVAKEILDRSIVHQLKDGTDTLFFKKKLTDGKISKRSQLVLKTGGKNITRYSSDKNSKTAIKQFKELISKYKESTGEIIVEKEPEPPIAEDFPVVDTHPDYVDIIGLSPDENRELRGVLNPSDTVLSESRVGENGALQIQADNFQKVINELSEKISEDENPFERIELQERIDGLIQGRNLTLDQKQLEEVRSQQESDISRLERFKEWAKENMAGLAAIAISIAGIITTVIVSARSVITKGATATSKFAKAVYKTFKEITKKLGPILGPVLSAIGSILATALKYGAKGLAWLSQNLWILVIALAWFAYDRISKKRK